jgi:hypothetical protein
LRRAAAGDRLGRGTGVPGQGEPAGGPRRGHGGQGRIDLLNRIAKLIGGLLQVAPIVQPIVHDLQRRLQQRRIALLVGDQLERRRALHELARELDSRDEHRRQEGHAENGDQHAEAEGESAGMEDFNERQFMIKAPWDVAAVSSRGEI